MIIFKEILTEVLSSRKPIKVKRQSTELYLRPGFGYKEEYDAGVYPRYISKDDLKDLLKILYNKTGKVTVKDVAQLAIDQKFWLNDTEVLELDTKDVWTYREYDRHLDPFLKKEIETLKQDIEKNGIHTPLMITIRHKNKNFVEVTLGEGNHRIAIANKMINIKTVPVKFTYWRS